MNTKVDRHVGGDADLRRSSKAEQVYAEVKESILSGTLQPGAAIDKIALCERLGVSRFPVSTAINRLAFERLVLIEPQHGSFVAKIATTDVREWMMIRRALETEITGELALNLTADVRASLGRNLRYQQTASEAGDRFGFYALDVEFHRLIIRALGFVQAIEILESLRAHLERLRRLLLAPIGRMSDAFAEHQAIVAALESGQRQSARQAMRQHLEQTTRLFEDFARACPDLFAA